MVCERFLGVANIQDTCRNNWHFLDPEENIRFGSKNGNQERGRHSLQPMVEVNANISWAEQDSVTFIVSMLMLMLIFLHIESQELC